MAPELPPSSVTVTMAARSAMGRRPGVLVYTA